MSNQIEHSLNNIRSELGFLAQSAVLSPQQYSSIMAQLPVCLLRSSSLRSTYLRPLANQLAHVNSKEETNLRNT